MAEHPLDRLYAAELFYMRLIVIHVNVGFLQNPANFELQGSLMRQAAGNDSQAEQSLALFFAFKPSNLTTWYKRLK
jgi:hypothetical protein